jgi:hypothetical protein
LGNGQPTPVVGENVKEYTHVGLVGVGEPIVTAGRHHRVGHVDGVASGGS